MLLWPCQDVATLLEEDPAYFLSFTLIIAVNLPAEVEQRLSLLLWQGEKRSSLLLDRTKSVLTVRSPL